MVRYLAIQYYFYNYTMFESVFPLLPLQSLPIQNYQNDKAIIIQTELLEQNQKLKSNSNPVDDQKIKIVPCSGTTSKKKNQKMTSIPKKQSQQCQKDSFTEKRNIIPNNINHILAFVQRKSKSSLIVQKIIRNQGEGSKKFTSKNFYCYQCYLKDKLQIHVNKNTLETITNHLQIHSEIFTIEEQLFYNRVCRIAIFYYLRHMALLTTLNSKRLKQTSKNDHLRAQRILMKFLQQHHPNI